MTEIIAHAELIGYEALVDRGRAAAEALGDDLVYAGFSLGVMPAQLLAQTRSGPRGALFFHGCVPPEEFGGSWPHRLPLQIHTMDGDELGDLDVARELVRTVPGAEPFLYPGREHLFADSSLPGYDEPATALLKQRVLAFLAALG